MQRIRITLLLIVFASFFLFPLANLTSRAAESPSLLARLGNHLYGSPWSSRFVGIEWLDAMAMGSLLLLGGVGRFFSGRLWLSFLPTLAISALFGRVFCGWICPMRLLLDMLAPVKRWWRTVHPGFTPSQRSARLRYGFLVLFAGLTFASGAHLPSLFYPPAMMARVGHGLVLFQVLHWSLLLFALYLLLDALFVTGAWCRYVCPGGVLYSALGRYRLVRLELDKNACTACQLCTKACPVGLDPARGYPGSECDNCGACMRPCATNALRYEWGVPWRKGAGGVAVAVKPELARVTSSRGSAGKPSPARPAQKPAKKKQQQKKQQKEAKSTQSKSTRDAKRRRPKRKQRPHGKTK